MQENRNQIVDLACSMLGRRGGFSATSVTGIDLLTGDGSPRRFYRIMFADNRRIIAVLPSQGQDNGTEEARSAWLIGCHLYRAAVPVPEPLAYEPASGMILFEDLGDTRLYDAVLGRDIDSDQFCFALYRDAVRELAHMQTAAAEAFDPSWCWQTPAYDRQLMLERESGYFHQTLCRDFFGLEPDVAALYREFGKIADQAAAAPAFFFLHRDFQSRNIMVQDSRIRIIDFQGGRLGPLGYDLASLLIDPYVCLPETMQESLLAEYISCIRELLAYDEERFRSEYLYLALQRNMQALGAFAFLGGQRGKPFFLPFIRPGLLSLQALLVKAGSGQYPVLTRLVETCLEMREPNDN